MILSTSNNVVFIDCNFPENIYTIVDIQSSYNVISINCNIYGNKGTNAGTNLAFESMRIGGSHNVILSNCSIYANSVTALGRKAYIFWLSNTQNMTFIDCIFSNNKGTPISAYNSNFTLSVTILFSDNTDIEGGGLAFYGESYVYIANNTNVTFLNNVAENVGGAIWI